MAILRDSVTSKIKSCQRYALVDTCGPTEFLHDIAFLQRDEIGISIQEQNYTVSIENLSSEGEGCGSRSRKNLQNGTVERSRTMLA